MQTKRIKRTIIGLKTQIYRYENFSLYGISKIWGIPNYVYFNVHSTYKYMLFHQRKY